MPSKIRAMNAFATKTIDMPEELLARPDEKDFELVDGHPERFSLGLRTHVTSPKRKRVHRSSLRFTRLRFGLVRRWRRWVRNSSVCRIVILVVVLLGAGCAREDERYQVPGLMEMLKDKDPDNRCTAAQVLGSYGPEAKVSVPLLAAALKDENATVRICVTYGLAEIGPDATAAADALVETLAKDHDAQVRVGAAYALGTLRSNTPPILAALRAAARGDREQNVRDEADRALKSISGSDGKTPRKKSRARNR
jgi:hypothetical protein